MAGRVPVHDTGRWGNPQFKDPAHLRTERLLWVTQPYDLWQVAINMTSASYSFPVSAERLIQYLCIRILQKLIVTQIATKKHHLLRSPLLLKPTNSQVSSLLHTPLILTPSIPKIHTNVILWYVSQSCGLLHQLIPYFFQPDYIPSPSSLAFLYFNNTRWRYKSHTYVLYA